MLREDFTLDEAIRYLVMRIDSPRHLNANSLVYTSDDTKLPYKDKPLSKKQAKNRAASKKARKARKK